MKHFIWGESLVLMVGRTSRIGRSRTLQEWGNQRWETLGMLDDPSYPIIMRKADDNLNGAPWRPSWHFVYPTHTFQIKWDLDTSVTGVVPGIRGHRRWRWRLTRSRFFYLPHSSTNFNCLGEPLCQVNPIDNGGYIYIYNPMREVHFLCHLHERSGWQRGITREMLVCAVSWSDTGRLSHWQKVTKVNRTSITSLLPGNGQILLLAYVGLM